MVYPILHSQKRCFQVRKTYNWDCAGVAVRDKSLTSNWLEGYDTAAKHNLTEQINSHALKYFCSSKPQKSEADCLKNLWSIYEHVEKHRSERTSMELILPWASEEMRSLLEILTYCTQDRWKVWPNIQILHSATQASLEDIYVYCITSTQQLILD